MVAGSLLALGVEGRARGAAREKTDKEKEFRAKLFKKIRIIQIFISNATLVKVLARKTSALINQSMTIKKCYA